MESQRLAGGSVEAAVLSKQPLYLPHVAEHPDEATLRGFACLDRTARVSGNRTRLAPQ